MFNCIHASLCETKLHFARRCWRIKKPQGPNVCFLEKAFFFKKKTAFGTPLLAVLKASGANWTLPPHIRDHAVRTHPKPQTLNPKPSTLNTEP